jgi:hypothetical protein
MAILKSSQSSSQRGAIVIQMAVCLLALMAFTAFVVDYGVMWASRGQAQTSADAGALSGAISLAFDSATDFAAAQTKAQAVAKQNWVWGQAPDVLLSDVTFPRCPPGAPGVPDTCVKVDVFRNQVRSNPLPMFFGNLVGVTNQGVRATATAQIVTGDTTDCLRPWAVIDRWQEAAPPSGVDQDPGPFGPTSTYDKYSNGQGSNPPYEPDVYTPPSATDPGTGFTLPADEGRQFAIKIGGGNTQVSSGWFQTIDLARSDTTNLGNNTVQSNISSCAGEPASIAAPGTVCPATIPNNWADTVYWETQGCFRVQTGAAVGSTANSVNALIARDSGAHWVDGTGIAGSAFDPPARSPRVVPIGVMDVDQYLALNPNGGTGVLRMVNMYGFFIEGMGDVDRNTGAITVPTRNGQSVIGRIMTIPALAKGSKLTNNASFLRSIILVR